LGVVWGVAGVLVGSAGEGPAGRGGVGVGAHGERKRQKPIKKFGRNSKKSEKMVAK